MITIDSMSTIESHRDRFNKVIVDAAEKKRGNSNFFTRQKFDLLRQNLESILSFGCQAHEHYHQAKQYELKEFGLIKKIVRRGTEKFIIASDEIFDAIHAAHIQSGHGGRNILEKELFVRYANVTREQIMIYLNLCECCQMKKVKVKKGVVVQPIVTKNFNVRCQVSVQRHLFTIYRYLLYAVTFRLT